jgi:hypothetical protein
MVYRERAEDVTVCTLKGLSGQYEFHVIFDSVVYLIGLLTVKLCLSVALIIFGTYRDNRYAPNTHRSSISGEPAALLFLPSF